MNQIFDKPIVIFDCETTGVNAATDKIIEMVVQKFYTVGGKLTDYKRFTFNPGVPITNSEIHGLTDEMVADKPFFKTLSSEILEFMNGCDLVGYNIVGFDLPLLINEFQRCEIDFDVSSVRIIDIFKIYKKLNPQTLGAVFERYMGRPHDNAHNALGDVEATGDIFHAMFSKGEIGQTMDEIEKLSVDRTNLIDLGGVFEYVNGVATVMIGKNKGRPVTQCHDWLWWLLRQNNFALDVKRYARKFLNNEETTKAETQPTPSKDEK